MEDKVTTNLVILSKLRHDWLKTGNLGLHFYCILICKFCFEFCFKNNHHSQGSRGKGEAISLTPLRAKNFEFTPFIANLEPLAKTSTQCQWLSLLVHWSFRKGTYAIHYKCISEVYVSEAEGSRVALILWKYFTRRQNKV